MPARRSYPRTCAADPTRGVFDGGDAKTFLLRQSSLECDARSREEVPCAQEQKEQVAFGCLGGWS